MTYDPMAHFRNGAELVASLIDGTTEEWETLLPSQWAETVRYLPRSTSPKPGPFSFADTPYWREVVDCFSQDSDVHFVAVKKGAQVGATVAVLENLVGYLIDYIRSSPCLFYTADAELAQTRMDTAIMPMIQASGIGHLIQANDSLRANKRGATDKKLEWAGGGYMLPLGAVNASKQRSYSAPWLLRDEVSGWPLLVGRDGDPMVLTETRTNSYELTRRILDLSTPTTKETCSISKRYDLGDRRHYFVPCRHCGEMQVLKFRGRTDDGVFFGLRWETDDGVIVGGSVRYVCQFCSKEMINEDKAVIMPAGEWRPTAKSSRPGFRSYHLPALYAPPFARTWEAIARSWSDAWDDSSNLVKDGEKLQVFYNNDLGEAYEIKADRLKPYQVSPHKRHEYAMGQVPSRHAEVHAGGQIMILTMSVDVQASWLAVTIYGWAPSADNAGYAAYLVDYWHMQGETELPDAPVWGELSDIIDRKVYQINDGRSMPVSLTLIDASFRPDTVYQFCSQWDSGVMPLRGRDKPIRGGRMREFSVEESSTGVRYVAVTVDLYKDRWSAAMKRQWNGIDSLPRNCLSLPANIPDNHMNELTVEYVREKRDPQSGKMLGTYWHRPGGVKNELWDTTIYCTAALELIAHDVCVNEVGIDALIWSEFWEIAKDGRYWTDEDAEG